MYIYTYIYMDMRANSTTTPLGERKQTTGNSIPKPSTISKKVQKPWAYHWAEISLGLIGQVQISSYYFSPNFVFGVCLKRAFVAQFVCSTVHNCYSSSKECATGGST